MFARAIVTAAAVALAASGCGPKRTSVTAVPFDPAPSVARADDLLLRGCLDCFIDARAAYQEALDRAPGAAAAREGLVRAAALIDVRAGELGLRPFHALAAVRSHVAEVSPATARIAAVADALYGAAPDVRAIIREQESWAQELRALTPGDVVADYMWLALACGPYGGTLKDRDDRAAIADVARHAPLVAYKLAVTCNFRDRPALEAVQAAEPRLRELAYSLGQVALAGQPQINGPGGLPDLDAADKYFSDAYDWRSDWPAVTLSLANVALTGEDFPRALDFYDKTLALKPDEADAFVGKIRALTYLERSNDAVALATELLSLNRNPGDAFYWRAYNRQRLDQLDDAWADIESAAPTVINADVPKLAGLIAIRRREWTTAQERLRLSLTRRSTDCETRFYLQAVVAEQRDWPAAATEAREAAACFDGEEQQLTAEVMRKQAEAPSARRDRQIARRQAELAAARRMRATVWFNGAAANFNLANRDEARRLAEKLEGDPQFGDRARELIERLRP